ncbi:response regulator [Synoicihabitans lomoniglobus]|uniref:Response regulator transcription factor n=1 Tax=Synoicihabitans lomoniglobus TaxID=2909285 RepID=A0AAE9ZTR0_9BACT|nr:response regulator transcription factor [Opitutaceae bacterium LMO-M01]WED64111.1 response regulator transcription factor [Opitutaceae bacterium LMO-M01]
MAKTDRKTTLYIAEDHVAIRDLLARHLELTGSFDVVGMAADGEPIVDDCTRLKPDVLLLDLSLPKRTGLEVLRDLRTSNLPTKVMVFSSHNDSAIVREVVEAGALGMVEKTAPFDELETGLIAVAAGRAHFGAAVIQALQQGLQKHAEVKGASALTQREREVLGHVAAGRFNKEIADLLGVSVKTVENHRHNLMSKLDAGNAADLTRIAFKLGLVVHD